MAWWTIAGARLAELEEPRPSYWEHNVSHEELRRMSLVEFSTRFSMLLGLCMK